MSERQRNRSRDRTISDEAVGHDIRVRQDAFGPGSAAEASFRVDNGAVALRIDRAGASRVNGRGFGLARLNPRDPHAARSFRARLPGVYDARNGNRSNAL